MTDDKTRILATGSLLVGNGIRSVDTVMDELIRNCTDELHIAVYLLTSEKILKSVRKAVSCGIRTTLVLNSLDEHPSDIRIALQDMTRRYPHFLAGDFNSRTGSFLHTKILVADRMTAVVGSANFTHSGMTRNHEIGLSISGTVAGKLAGIVDRLYEKSGDIRTI